MTKLSDLEAELADHRTTVAVLTQRMNEMDKRSKYFVRIEELRLIRSVVVVILGGLIALWLKSQ